MLAQAKITPLHRITMSSYTTQEYGFPSSHSANATAVTLVLWKHFQESQSFSSATQYVLYFVLALYCISLVFGRVYCGMHGFIDCITGSLIGYVLFCFRYYLGSAFDFIVLTKLGWATPVLVSIAYILLIHFHSEPVDDCPCFDDSVAFIGVLIGIDICDWWLLKTTGSYAIPYDFETLGVGKSFLRVVIGVVLVAVWKSISKPIIFTILPPIYKIVGVYLPRRNFEATAFLKKTTRQIRSQSISNMNLQEQDIIGGTSKDVIGPSDDIDIYEMIDYEREKHKNDEKFKKIPFPSTEASTNIPSTSTESENKVSGVFRPRYDVEIVGRLFVYAGVATFALWGFAQAIKLTNLCA